MVQQNIPWETGTGIPLQDGFQRIDENFDDLYTLIAGLGAGDATLTALAAYNTNGLIVQTAPDTFTGRTITGTADEVAVANGNGGAGNPTISLPAALTLTGKTLTGGTFASPTAITGLPDPTSAQDAATKAYVDNIAAGFDVKPSCRAATTANITLSGTQTIDLIALVAGDRVLVKNQTTTSQNGIYVVAAGAWSRATDMDSWTKVPGAFAFVEAGVSNADRGFVCTADAGGILGTTSITWSQFAGTGTFTGGTGISVTGNTISVNDTELVALASLSSAADRLPYFTGFGTAALATFTAAARLVLDDATVAAMRTTLGLKVITPEDYGAVGNGTTDDTAALTTLWAVVNSTGNCLVWLNGYYKDTLARTITASNVHVSGGGKAGFIASGTSAMNAMLNVGSAMTGRTSQTLSVAAAKGTRALTFTTDVTGFAVGQVMRVDWGTHPDTRGFSFAIETLDVPSKTITISHPLPWTINTGVTLTVSSAVPVTNVRVEDVIFDVGTHTTGAISGVKVVSGLRCSLTNVRTNGMRYGGLVTTCAVDCVFDEFLSLGDGLSGSGDSAIPLYGATGCKFTRFTVKNAGYFCFSIFYTHFCQVTDLVIERSGDAANFRRALKTWDTVRCQFKGCHISDVHGAGLFIENNTRECSFSNFTVSVLGVTGLAAQGVVTNGQTNCDNTFDNFVCIGTPTANGGSDLVIGLTDERSKISNFVHDTAYINEPTTAWAVEGTATAAGGAVVQNLPVTKGGTGVSTFAANGVVYGNVGGALQVTAASGANYSVLVSAAAGAAPSWTSAPEFASLKLRTPSTGIELYDAGTAAAYFKALSWNTGSNPNYTRIHDPSGVVKFFFGNATDPVSYFNNNIYKFRDATTPTPVDYMWLSSTNLDLKGSVDLYRAGLQVLSTRKTGWTAPTGTATRTGYATGSATVTQVAEALKALIDDLISHGLIGA